MSAASYLIFLLQRVERVLADEALALGKVDRERVGVADLPVLAQRAERELHAAQRCLQREIGVEHAGETKLFQLRIRELGRAATEHDVDDLWPGQLADYGDLLSRLRRLDERHVGARLAIAMRALDGGLEAFDCNGIRACHNDEI